MYSQYERIQNIISILSSERGGHRGREQIFAAISFLQRNLELILRCVVKKMQSWAALSQEKITHSI